MAPKAPSHSRQPSKEKPEKEDPQSSEEEEEEESEADSSEEEKEIFSQEEEEGSSEDDEEEDQQKAKDSKNPIPVPKSDPKSVVQENGSDSESESEGSPSDYKLQPITKSPLASGKRTHQESDDDLRGSKKSRTEEKKSSSTPGGFITRLWSDEDEVSVLNGMIDFKNVKGLDPNADMGAFYNFIKGKLQVDFSREQLRTKITRLKKRFLNALKKGENGLDPVISKPHEIMVFELSKKIWGGARKNGAGNAIQENRKNDIVKAKKIGGDEKEIVKKEKDDEDEDIWSKYPFFSASFLNMVGNFPSLAMPEAGMSFLKERLSLIGNMKAKELDEKWKQLAVEEAELNYKMLTLMKEQVKMAFDL